MSDETRDDAVDEVPELAHAGHPLRDGIAEEDHPVPIWFNFGFYGLIVVGILYILYYVGGGWTQEAWYAQEVLRIEAELAEFKKTLPSANPYASDAAAIAEGKQTFETICAVCHKPDGTGLVGPSLVDAYWKYGSDDEARFTSVSEGRPGGMPPWGAQLGTEKIWKVLAYAATLPRQDAPGVGAPEYEPPAAAQ